MSSAVCEGEERDTLSQNSQYVNMEENSEVIRAQQQDEEWEEEVERRRQV